jgi:[ribosomal protein S5]-alanine N-acetyltransferase
MARSLSAPTLPGPLVSLRPWRASDADALEPACGDSDICRFTTVPRGYTRADDDAWIARQHQRLATGTAIVPTGSETPVGMVGLFGLDQDTRSARSGYWLIREVRGRGLASAATQMLARWAFQELGLEILLLDVEPANRASQRVAEALGARALGEVQREHDNECVTLARYSLPAQAMLDVEHRKSIASSSRQRRS